MARNLEYGEPLDVRIQVMVSRTMFERLLDTVPATSDVSTYVRAIIIENLSGGQADYILSTNSTTTPDNEDAT